MPRIGFDFQVGPGRDRDPSRSNSASPMRILLVGDFSGRTSRGVQGHGDLATRKPLAVDIDNFDRVMQRLVAKRDIDEVLTCLSHRLGDGDGYFTSLAETVANAARSITHHCQSSKAELPAAFDDFRSTIDCDELLDELVT